MWWIIIATVIFLLLIYLLFAPFFVEIDSNNDLYCVRFHRLASASIFLDHTTIFLKLRIAWWRKNIKLSGSEHTKKKTRQVVKREAKKSTVSPHKILKKAKAIVKTFKVNECLIMIDTGNMPLNGILYPWLYFLSRYSGKTIMINFWNENQIKLQVENNAARIIMAYLKS
jgi:hypothetical protein